MMFFKVKRFYLMAFLILCAAGVGIQLAPTTSAQAPTITVTRIATGLQNPRGVAVLPDGRLLVAQAGLGYVSGDPEDNTGKLSLLDDLNGDGVYEDEGEITHLFEQLPGYNILYQFSPGRDEVVGIGDVLVLSDERILFTLDDNFEVLSIVEVSPEFERVGDFLRHEGSLNSLAYDEQREVIYVAESTFNAVSMVSLSGQTLDTFRFGPLAHHQQAVPAGVAVDPLTGDVLVALFSGQLWDYYGSILSFMPGDAKVVRINPETGEQSDEITGLTAAVDVAVDEQGNMYVVEMTTTWPTPMLAYVFDLYDPDAPPDPGGYARYTGRVTMYPAGDVPPVVLADRLDQPTNVTYHEGLLYISTGQGTPGRSVWYENGLTQIVGEIYTIRLDE